MLSAVAFLTVLGRSRAPDHTTMRWFPFVGAAVGAVVGGSWWGAQQLWSPGVAAAVAVAVDLAITGMLHLDGLADTADGLLPHLDRERRLAVMRQPDVGAFGVGVIAIVVLLRWAALSGAGEAGGGSWNGGSGSASFAPIALIAVWSMSRTVVAAIPAFVPYARDRGITTPFIAGASRLHLMWVLPAAALLVVSVDRTRPGAVLTAVVASAALVAVALGVTALARRRLGGFTGDVLGAVVLVGETAALLALAATP